MRAVFFWEAGGLSLDRANPYGALLARAMRGVGIELEPGYPDTLTEAWLYENRGRVDLLHLNWPNYMYDEPDLKERVARCAEMIGNLALARTLGYKIVWTVHNLYPHESISRELDRLAQTAITHVADAVIVHCNHARALVAQHFRREEGVFVVPHGNFIYPYPNDAGREEARRRMGLTDENLAFFYFGNVRRYKGLERLLEVFASLPGEHLRLLLCAKVYTGYGEQLAASVSDADPRVILRTSRHFANEEFQYLFNAGDIGIFPFLEVLTSGSVITAFSFGLPGDRARRGLPDRAGAGTGGDRLRPTGRGRVAGGDVVGTGARPSGDARGGAGACPGAGLDADRREDAAGLLPWLIACCPSWRSTRRQGSAGCAGGGEGGRH